MRFKLAILNVLAKCPGGRATLDEVRREVRVIIASGDQTEQLKRFFEFGDIDIFQSGLVLRDDAGLEITDAGLSLLHSLESSAEPSLEFSSAPLPQRFDSPSSIEERLRTLDLEPRTLDNIAFDGNENNGHQPDQDEGNPGAALEGPDSEPSIGAGDPPERVDTEADNGSESDEDDQPAQAEGGQQASIEAAHAASSDVAAFVQRSSDSGGQETGQRSRQLPSLLTFVTEKGRFIAGAWRRADGRGPWKLYRSWKRSVGGLSGRYFGYLWFGLVSAAVVVAALFSMPHRPQKPERPEQAMAVAVAPPPAPSFDTLPGSKFNALPPGNRTLFDPNPSPTLRHSDDDEIPVPGTPEPAVQIDVRRVLKLMNAGVAKYASGQDEASKVRGAKLIQIAALLGYQTARNLVVVNYPRAASVRAAVTVPDVILYAMDRFQAKQPEAVTEFVTLANYFAARGEIAKFAKVVVDVARDDVRLSDAEQVGNLFKALDSVRGVCSAIKRLVLNDPTLGENDCSDTLQGGLLAQAKGSNGLEKAARDRGTELMRRTDAAP